MSKGDLEPTGSDGGENAIRGILCQAAICLVAGLESEDWHSVQLEGLRDAKASLRGVDIIWRKSTMGGLDKFLADEVKSSLVRFSRARIEEYAKTLVTRHPGADNYTLHLVGTLKTASDINLTPYGVKIVNRFPLNRQNLLEGVRDALLRYSVRKKMTAVSPLELLFLADALVTRLLDFTVASVEWKREEFQTLVESRLQPAESPWKAESEELEHFEKIFGFRAPPLLRRAVLLFYLSAESRTAAWQLKIARARLFSRGGRLAVRVSAIDRIANAVASVLLWAFLAIGIALLLYCVWIGHEEKKLNTGLLLGMVAYFTFLIPGIIIALSNQEQSVAVRLHTILAQDTNVEGNPAILNIFQRLLQNLKTRLRKKFSRSKT